MRHFLSKGVALTKTILGIDQLEAYDFLFRGKRIGLVTNYSGVDSAWRENIDLMMQRGWTVQRIFTPEHGLYGCPDGIRVENLVHPQYGMPVISLYGENRAPSADDLQDLDLMVFDLQDVGLRYYTFLYTLTGCMEAAAGRGIPFVVLDRPDPLSGSATAGCCILPEYASFVGNYGLPVRYGFTIGEFGKYFLEQRKPDLDYQVVPMLNYNRHMFYPDTGLLWNVPSPALGSFESVICYSGGCFAEATNLSEGRGTAKPFQIYGAPFLNMDSVCRKMQERVKDDKVAFRKRAFVPQTSKYAGQICYGLEFAPLAEDLDFIPVMLQFLHIVKELYPEQLVLKTGAEQENNLAALTGSKDTERYLEGELELDELLSIWKDGRRRFEMQAEDVRIYGE